jgi:hypothetical protein
VKLKEIDFTGLEMASRSFARKRASKQAASALSASDWWLRILTNLFTAKVVCTDISSQCDESRELQRPPALTIDWSWFVW